VPWATIGDPFTAQLLGAGPWPDQGWKLHVSATVRSAAGVLTRVLPLLSAEGARFKVASSLDAVAGLNTGWYGPTQVGKVVTVYPSDDAQAVRLAVALDRATEGLRGPRVPTDRQLRPGSLVHYRYGAFTVRGGDAGHDLLDLGGRLAFDRRASFYAPPFPVADPFEAAGAYVPPNGRRGAIAGRYLVHELLFRSWRGGVYRAVDVRTQCRRWGSRRSTSRARSATPCVRRRRSARAGCAGPPRRAGCAGAAAEAEPAPWRSPDLYDGAAGIAVFLGALALP